MRALFFDGQLALRRDYRCPQPRSGESIVRVRLAGICGTDLEIARGYMAYRGVPGHEFVGEVVQSARRTLIGKRVAGEINAGCGQCRWCGAGMDRHCPDRTVLGILGRDGAFADYLQLPDQNLVPLADSIPDRRAVFIEPLAAAFEILDQTTIHRNERLLVLGDGRLGALAALVLKSEGYDVLLAGHHDRKLEELGGLGLKTARAEAIAPGFDLAVDCTGSPQGFARAVELVRPRGRVVIKSTAAGGAELNLASAVVNELTLIGSRCGRFAPAVAALAAGRIDPSPLISGEFALDGALDAMAAAAAPPNFKILLRMS